MPGYTKSVAATAPAFTPDAQNLGCAWNRVTLATGELTLNAVHPLVRLPYNSRVHDVVLRVSDMDSGAAGIVSVGVAGDTERYIRRVSIQAAGAYRSGNDATAVGTMIAAAAFTGETTIDLLVQTAPGTAVAGTVEIAVFYTVE